MLLSIQLLKTHFVGLLLFILPLNTSIYFAPLQSYTTLSYYLAYHTLFDTVHKYFTPFYRKNKEDSFAYEKQLIFQPQITIIPQVLVNNSTDLIQFARDMKARGFKEINLNMGCPFPMVANRGLGAGILPLKDKVEVMLNDFYEADLSIDLSVKTRLGWAYPDELRVLMDVFNSLPIKEIIIHPRLGIQKYKGEPDWNAFDGVVQGTNHRVIGNGDICSVDHLTQLKKRFPEVVGWMIGRGLLINPSLLMLDGEDKVACRKNILQLHELFKDNLYQCGYAEAQILNHLKAFWEYPSQLFEGGARMYRKIRKLGKMEDYRSAVNSFSDQCY